jgi:Universal stress protein UspA and related nucleotide-binding proteins
VFTNILVALDGSEASQRALVRAVDEAERWKAKLQVIYVVEMINFSSLTPDNTLEGENTREILYRVMEKEGKEVLRKAKKSGTEKGLTVITHLKQGHAGIEIVSLAEQEKSDLIVVGSHGKSNIDRLLMGSVSTFVVTHSKITTIVVRT